ncbi:sugar phosphate isomerase/epimerase family protein [Sinomonas sp. P10A9]|uniref:Sugar phosphate isomerase/epimerase family protein n=1 Tax=Sinomonas puerhi TaxID=3238584 RepID=A0AB39L4J6_9MICC
MTASPQPSVAKREVGLAQLSLLDTAPPDLVLIAAEAGFDFIGARVRPVTRTERKYDLSPGSPMLAETLANVRSTGVRVLDTEFLLIDGTNGAGAPASPDAARGRADGQRDAWLPMLEAARALGAETLTVAAADPDPVRFAETLALLAEDGREFGITPTLEPISYQRINSLASAAAAARAAGARVVVDTLHFRRFGGALEELAAMADLVPMLQLCDAPAARPADREGLIHESRAARLAPGEGGLNLAEIVAALPSGTPVSVEAPSPADVVRLGELGWARHLKRAADRVLEEAHTLIPSSAESNGATR